MKKMSAGPQIMPHLQYSSSCKENLRVTPKKVEVEEKSGTPTQQSQRSMKRTIQREENNKNMALFISFHFFMNVDNDFLYFVCQKSLKRNIFIIVPPPHPPPDFQLTAIPNRIAVDKILAVHLFL